jgi:type IV pilus assembly protein PilE
MTLVELLVVVTIVGILAAIAVPSYRAYVIRVKRADAKVALTSAAQRMERCYTRSNTYVGCDTGYPLDTPGATYTIAFNPAPTATQFTVTATPINGQADDTDCAAFALNETGKQTVTGTKSAKPTECW